MEQNKQEAALRFDKGKLRLDLIDPIAMNDLAEVLTFGASKYAPHNWMKGMSWSRVIGSLERHLNAIKRGEDYDSESMALHIGHVLCNAMFLANYYRTHPELDDRPHCYLEPKKIGLDIDDVLADLSGYMGISPKFWNHDRTFRDTLLAKDKDFWLNIPIKTRPEDLGFQPHCYITARSIPAEWTQEWLDNNGFPHVPLYSVGFGMSKVQAAKESGIGIFVDDRFENFIELNKEGICTYLFDASHNQRYSVGYKRLYSLKELC